MSPVRTRYPLLVAALLFTSLAGCTEKDDAPVLTSEEAPEGPDSLRVGVVHDLEYSRTLTNISGHRIRIDDGWDGEGSPPYRVEPFVDTEVRERGVLAGVDGLDAFLRPMEMVGFGYRTTDLDPQEDEALERESASVYSLWNRSLIYSDFATFVYAGADCPALFLLPCDGNVAFEGTMARSYFRDIRDGSWGNLEGLVLRLGEVVSFNETFEFGSDRFQVYLNYTPVREEFIGETRTFVVKVSSAVENLTPQLVSTNAEEPDEETAEELAEPPPEPVRLLWMAAEYPLPAKEYSSNPFLWRGDRYYRNASSVLELYETKGGPVAWGSGSPLPSLARMPGTTVTSANEVLRYAQTTDLTYPVEEAWAAIESDALLTEYRDFASAHPAAWPYRALYHPDPDRGVFTWMFEVGTESPDFTQGETLIVMSRRDFVAETGTFVTQNRIGDGFEFFVGFTWIGPESASAEVVTMADALATFRRLQPEAPEPAIGIELGNIGFQAQTVHFFEPEILFRDQDVPSSREVGVSGPNLVLSAADGGLEGLNTSFVFFFEEWPWLVPPALPIGDYAGDEVADAIWASRIGAIGA